MSNNLWCCFHSWVWTSERPKSAKKSVCLNLLNPSDMRPRKWRVVVNWLTSFLWERESLQDVWAKGGLLSYWWLFFTFPRVILLFKTEVPASDFRGGKSHLFPKRQPSKGGMIWFLRASARRWECFLLAFPNLFSKDINSVFQKVKEKLEPLYSEWISF